MKENEQENADEIFIEIFEKEVQEKVSVNDIDRSYQLGKNHTRSRHWSIITKFTWRNVRNAIFRKQS